MKSKRKFFVVALGTTGDVHPFLGIAAALQTRGHQVTFLANEHFREMVSRVGVAFRPIGHVADYETAVANPALWNPAKGFAVVWRCVAPAMKDIYDYLATRQAPTECTVVAHPLAAVAVGFAKEKRRDINVMTGYLSPSHLRSSHGPSRIGQVSLPAWLPQGLKEWLWKQVDARMIHPVVLPDLNALRKELGLAPIDNFAEYMYGAADLSLTLFPDWFAKPQPDWPHTVRSGDFVLFDSRSDTGLPDAVERFLRAGEPPIVFTPGSGMRHSAEFFRTSLHACLRLNRRAIFLTPCADQVPDNLPPTVKWFEYVPFRSLLRRAAALVHHGGIGSSAEAMRAGIPQLVMPMAHDQFDNAARIEAMGVGLRIKRRSYNVRTVAARLSALLASELIRTRCRNVAARFRYLGPVSRLCQVRECRADRS